MKVKNFYKVPKLVKLEWLPKRNLTLINITDIKSTTLKENTIFSYEGTCSFLILFFTLLSMNLPYDTM